MIEMDEEGIEPLDAETRQWVEFVDVELMQKSVQREGEMVRLQEELALSHVERARLQLLVNKAKELVAYLRQDSLTVEAEQRIDAWLEMDRRPGH